MKLNNRMKKNKTNISNPKGKQLQKINYHTKIIIKSECGK